MNIYRIITLSFLTLYVFLQPNINHASPSSKALKEGTKILLKSSDDVARIAFQKAALREASERAAKNQIDDIAKAQKIKTVKPVIPKIKKIIPVEKAKKIDNVTKSFANVGKNPTISIGKKGFITAPSAASKSIRNIRGVSEFKQTNKAVMKKMEKDKFSKVIAKKGNPADKTVVLRKKQGEKVLTDKKQTVSKLNKTKEINNQKLTVSKASGKNKLNKRMLSSSTKQLRKEPGVATYSGQLKNTNNPNWLKEKNSAFLPGQVAERLSGRSFKNFDEFRGAVWRDIAKDRVLSQNFKPSNLSLMRNGKAPFVTVTQQRGKRMRYELDHSRELQDGGSVYGLDNIRIKTPNAHVRKITRKFNLASDKQ